MARTEPDDLQVVSLLAEPTRGRLYRFVAASDRAVTREDAARQVDIPVHTAKFHLDRLVEAGLLEVEFRRTGERGGPGSGRPPKHYRRTRTEVSVVLPPRNYDLLSGLLADAIVEAARTREDAGLVAGRIAYQRGVEAARVAGSTGEEGSTGEDGLLAVLVANGYEPARTATGIVLRNCPFHRAAQRQTAFVCAVNRDFVAGILDGALPGAAGRARLDPGTDRCCVVLDVDSVAG